MLTLNYALVQDVAQIINDMVGEGMTPATILVNAIYTKPLRKHGKPTDPPKDAFMPPYPTLLTFFPLTIAKVASISASICM
jgi:hypothetical protein